MKQERDKAVPSKKGLGVVVGVGASLLMGGAVASTSVLGSAERIEARVANIVKHLQGDPSAAEGLFVRSKEYLVAGGCPKGQDPCSWGDD